MMRWILAGLACLASAATSGAVVSSLAYVEGADFAGGGAPLFGSSQYGETGVNYVYAIPTGERSRMTAHFSLASVPGGKLFLYITARDDDRAGACAVELLLNGQPVPMGLRPFREDAWEARAVPVPDGLLRAGENEVTVRNREAAGTLGMPPWFMLARMVPAPEGYTEAGDLKRNFHVELPTQMRPFPEPLPTGAAPGFAIRGTKGWMWTPKQYLAEIPWLARYKMNFLMNCYTSMCDVEHFAWGDPRANRWWEPLPAAKKRAYEKVVRSAQRHGIQYCFSMNPCLCTSRIMKYRSAADLDAIWQHYQWMQGLGVRWFNLSLDDISEGIDASAQAYAVNQLVARLRRKDPGVQFVFCPTLYWGDGRDDAARPYLETLARELDPQVYLFWTGNAVVGTITREAAESFRSIARHRLILWDNYPVNDNTSTMHLGPVIDRDPDLCRVVEGYMSNPMCRQDEANRIPLGTCADYAYNPAAYDPLRSIGQVILQQAGSRRGREALRDMVEAYPGMLVCGRPQTNFNSLLDRFSRIRRLPHSGQLTKAYSSYILGLLQRICHEFPGRYRPEVAQLRHDLAASTR